MEQDVSDCFPYEGKVMLQLSQEARIFSVRLPLVLPTPFLGSRLYLLKLGYFRLFPINRTEFQRIEEVSLGTASAALISQANGRLGDICLSLFFCLVAENVESVF